MDGALSSAVTTRLRERLLYLAWRRYRLARDIGEDLIQSALVTWIEVRHRYPREEEHARILIGIFRNKCREHIDRHVRTERKRKALLTSVLRGDVGTPSIAQTPSGEEGIVDDLVRREQEILILEALRELRPPAREMFRLIIEEGATRKDLIEYYGLNKNTLDSRLHTYRIEFRKLLARRGIEV